MCPPFVLLLVLLESSQQGWACMFVVSQILNQWKKCIEFKMVFFKSLKFYFIFEIFMKNFEVKPISTGIILGWVMVHEV